MYPNVPTGQSLETDEQPQVLRQVILLGVTVLAATLLPLMVGLWLDQRYQTTPWLTVVGLVTGTALASAGVLLITHARFAAVEKANSRRKTTDQPPSTPQPPTVDDEQEDNQEW